MPTTDQDARALTYLAKRLREETYGANTWDEAGIHAVIAKLIGRNLPTLVEQVTRHASDPEAKTPGAINRPFLPEAPKAGANYPPKKHEACPNHPGHRADSCAGCAADKLAGDPTAEPVRPRPSGIGQQALRQARAELARVQQDTCGHGVSARGRCADCGERETETTTAEEAS